MKSTDCHRLHWITSVASEVLDQLCVPVIKEVRSHGKSQVLFSANLWADHIPASEKAEDANK